MDREIGSILRKKRIESGVSVREISKRLIDKGYKASEKTIYSWENGNSHPTPDALLEMCDAYGIADILSTFGYNGYKKDGSLQLSMSEVDLIEKYRFLSLHSPDGAETVNYILNREYRIAAHTGEASGACADSPVRCIPYYRHSASAGTGQVTLEGVPVDRVRIPDIPEYGRVSYAIGVHGDGMEPFYCDGDVLLIEPTFRIEEGETGIFIIGAESYVKKLGKKEVISLTAGYKRLPLTADSKCVGRIVGKLTNTPYNALSQADVQALKEGLEMGTHSSSRMA